MKAGMRSDVIKKGNSRAPHRSLLRATGQIRDARDFDKPFVAVCNSYVRHRPRPRASAGVRQRREGRHSRSRRHPLRVQHDRVDDGIVMGHDGMRYSLPSRELIADAVETMVARALLRRDDLHPQLRQDRAGHADGRRARQRARRYSSPAGRCARGCDCERQQGRPDHACSKAWGSSAAGDDRRTRGCSSSRRSRAPPAAAAAACSRRTR